MPLNEEERKILDDIEDHLNLLEPLIRPYGRPPMRIPPPARRRRSRNPLRGLEAADGCFIGAFLIWAFCLLCSIAVVVGVAVLVWKAILS